MADEQKPRITLLGVFAISPNETIAVVAPTVEDAAAAIEEAAFLETQPGLGREAQAKRTLFHLPDLSEGTGLS
jgi:hypothetical protein